MTSTRFIQEFILSAEVNNKMEIYGSGLNCSIF